MLRRWAKHQRSEITLTDHGLWTVQRIFVQIGLIGSYDVLDSRQLGSCCIDRPQRIVFPSRFIGSFDTQKFRITQIMVDQRPSQIMVQSIFSGSFDAPWFRIPRIMAHWQTPWVIFESGSVGSFDAPSCRIPRIVVYLFDRLYELLSKAQSLISLMHHDPGSLGCWYINNPVKSLCRVDSLVSLMCQNPNDLWSQSLIEISPKEHSFALANY